MTMESVPCSTWLSKGGVRVRRCPRPAYRKDADGEWQCKGHLDPYRKMLGALLDAELQAAAGLTAEQANALGAR
jgi:hypothetical protein